MPIIKSAVKRMRQTKVRTARNRTTKDKLRNAIKAVEAAVKAEDAKAAQTALVDAQSAIDTAVKKNLIHKNRAARKKSQLNTQVKAIAGSSKPTKKTTAAKKPAAKKPTTKKAATAKKATKTTKKPAAKKTATKTKKA